LLLAGGGCPTVGVAGFTLGGGLSFLSRSLGLGCDSMLSATMVLANATVVNVTKKSYPELFWALCGGGGGLTMFLVLFFGNFCFVSL
jgi:FAD/FMN-containing dehydrogenase